MEKELKLKLITLTLSVVIFLSLLGMAEFALYLLNFDYNKGFNIKNSPLFIEQTINDTRYYRNNPAFDFRDAFFKLEKDNNTKRIFIIGGSAAFGAGVGKNETFAYLLEKRLNIQFPSKRFEVINVAYPGYSSNEDVLVIEEISHYSPDFVILYSGNNEFLRLVYNYQINQNVFSKAAQSMRTIALVRKLIGKVKRREYSFDEYSQFVPFVLDNISNNFSSNTMLLADEKVFSLYLNNYLKNINKIINISTAKGTEIIISNIPTNLYWPPTKSVHIEKVDQIGFLNEYETKGRFFSGRCKEALSELNLLISKDPYYAEYHFFKGLCLASLNETKQSINSLKLAKKYDAYPIRQPDELNTALEELAKQRKVPFVNAVELFHNETGSENFRELFADQTHPNRRGHEILANVFFETVSGKIGQIE